MSATTCESASKGPYEGALGEIKGEQIVEVEIRNGGYKYCDFIEMKLTGGKFLQFSRHLDISSYGINPRIQYKVGGWSKWEPRRDKKTDCEGQLYFSFLNES
jgi:hypothetical protein